MATNPNRPTLLIHESLSYNNQPRPLVNLASIRAIVPERYNGEVTDATGSGTRAASKLTITAPTTFDPDRNVVSPLAVQATTDYGFKPLLHLLGSPIGKRKSGFAGNIIVEGSEPTVTKLAAFMTAATWHAKKRTDSEWFMIDAPSPPVQSHSLKVGVPEELRKDARFLGFIREMAHQSRQTAKENFDYRDLRPTMPRNGEFDASVFNVACLGNFVFTAARVWIPDQAKREREMLAALGGEYDQFAGSVADLDAIYGGTPAHLATLYNEYVLNENSPLKAAENMHPHLKTK